MIHSDKIMDIVKDFLEKCYNNNHKPWKSSRILDVKFQPCKFWKILFFMFFIFSCFQFLEFSLFSLFSIFIYLFLGRSNGEAISLKNDDFPFLKIRFLGLGGQGEVGVAHLRVTSLFMFFNSFFFHFCFS